MGTNYIAAIIQDKIEIDKLATIILDKIEIDLSKYELAAIILDKIEIDLSEYELAAIEIPDKKKHPRIPHHIKHKQVYLSYITTFPNYFPMYYKLKTL